MEVPCLFLLQFCFQLISVGVPDFSCFLLLGNSQVGEVVVSLLLRLVIGFVVGIVHQLVDVVRWQLPNTVRVILIRGGLLHCAAVVGGRGAEF